MKCPYCGIENKSYDSICRYCGDSLITPTIDWLEVYGHYNRLEKNLIDFFKYVPLEKKHYHVFSPKLFDLYLQIGVGIEQQLKYIYSYMYPNKKIPEDIRILFGCCSTKFKLKKIEIVVHYAKSIIIRPFNSLNITNKGLPTHPDFQIYSKFKHEWIEMLKMTTLIRTIKFLSMYFVLLCENPSTGNFEFLRNIGILRKKYDPTESYEKANGTFFDQYREFLIQYPKVKKYMPYTVEYRSSLFQFKININTNPQSSI